MVRVKSSVKMGFGILFVVLALISIFDFWAALAIEFPWQVWPIGIILVGVLFMIRQKGLAFAVVLLMIVFGILSGGWHCCNEMGELREFNREFNINDFDYVDLDLNYGVGDVVIAEGKEKNILFGGLSRNLNGPEIMEVDVLDKGLKKISVSRGSDFGDGNKWLFELSDDVVYNLDLEYGVSNVDLDLRGLKVDRLDISEGVSDTRIVFGDHPVVVNIEGGVSDFDFEFVDGSGVVIEVEGGLLDKDFEGFVKRDGKYYSEGYDAEGENIVISFSGGVGDLNSVFY